MMHAEEWIPIENDPMLPPALAAMGFKVKPNVHLFPDAPTAAAHKTVSWMISPLSGCGLYDARNIIPDWRAGVLPANHPLRACMMALATRQVLAGYIRGNHGTPHVVKLPGVNLCRAIPPSDRSRVADLSPRLSGPTEKMPIDHAAAAIVCGHGIQGIAGQAFLISSRGAFDPLVTAATMAAAAAQIESNASRSASITLPGYPAGEHPFLYALAAISQARALSAYAEKKDPTVHLNSRSSERVALVSQSILEGPTNFKDHVARHIR